MISRVVSPNGRRFPSRRAIHAHGPTRDILPEFTGEQRVVTWVACSHSWAALRGAYLSAWMWARDQLSPA